MSKVSKLFADQDYWSQLSTSEKQWLNRFNREFYETYNLKEADTLHSAEYHRDLYKSKNARRRDVLNQFHIIFEEVN